MIRTSTRVFLKSSTSAFAFFLLQVLAKSTTYRNSAAATSNLIFRAIPSGGSISYNSLKVTGSGVISNSGSPMWLLLFGKKIRSPLYVIEVLMLAVGFS